jgi:leucyl/phenylalanyl-tRNA---protein transferase
LGTQPQGIGGEPNLLRMCFDEFLAPDYALPDPDLALSRPAGLAGIVHEFASATILAAYRRGLYPHAHIAPLKWWSPPQRPLLFFAKTHLANRLRRQMRQGQYSVTFDRGFEGVITACAGHRSVR